MRYFRGIGIEHPRFVYQFVTNISGHLLPKETYRLIKLESLSVEFYHTYTPIQLVTTSSTPLKLDSIKRAKKVIN